MESRVFYMDIDNSIHSDRTVVVPVVVRLKQSDCNVCIGTHLAGGLQLEGGVTGRGIDPFHVADGFPVFKADDGYTTCC